MKYNIPKICKYLFGMTVFVGVTACTDNAIEEIPLIDFGLKDNVYVLDTEAGHVDLAVYTSTNCTLSFLEDVDWASLSRKNINSDTELYVDYDDNEGFPRMAKVLVKAVGTNLTDTITLKQKGKYMPAVKMAQGTMVLNGKSNGEDEADLSTNINFSDAITARITYTGGEGSDWIEGVKISGQTMVEHAGAMQNAKLNVSFVNNPSQEPRTATIELIYDNGWGEEESTPVYVTQRNKANEIGHEVTYEQLRGMAHFGSEVKIDDFIIISGYVVSEKASRNAGDNPKVSQIQIDYSVCDRTVYLESLDGKYGFDLLCKDKSDNVFNRYDKVSILLKGTKLGAENDPDRYQITGITSQMILSQTPGSKSDIPVKEKYFSELTDADINTYVTLKDCEFPVRQGSLTPVHEGYTLGGNAHRLSKYPRLMRDIQGSSFYLYTNTTCPYRRDGRCLPYGSGKISGVVVFEYFKPFVYGDGVDSDTHGRIGTYQLRHQSYDDIQIAANTDNGFSKILTEYCYIKDKAKDNSTGLIYWYPTYGTNGRFTQTSSKYQYGCWACTSWKYIGKVGDKNGVEPFRNHIGNDGSGMGIILEDGTNYQANNKNINSDGRGQENYISDCPVSWANRFWWEEPEKEGDDPVPNSWLVEFSTRGIQTDHISMQISVQSGAPAERQNPIYWKAEWSLSSDYRDDTKWHMIGEYQVPDFPIWANPQEWQLPAYKQINFELPLDILDHDMVYIRLQPISMRSNTSWGFDADEVEKPYNYACSAMDYFAVRYNK